MITNSWEKGAAPQPRLARARVLGALFKKTQSPSGQLLAAGSAGALVWMAMRAVKPAPKPPIFRPFGPSSPPKRRGLTAIRGVGGRTRPNKLAGRLSQTHVPIEKCRCFFYNSNFEGASPDQS